MAKKRAKTTALGGAVAVIFGVVLGVVFIVGVGAYYAYYVTQPVETPEVVVAAVDVPLLAEYAEHEEPTEIASEVASDPGPAYEVFGYEPSYDEPSYGDPSYSEPSSGDLSYGETSPYTTITISAAGDTTLGGDARWAGYHRFMREFSLSGEDHSYFFRNVRDIFYYSCLAIVNLEGALTYAYYHLDKEFVFRGPPHFARILSAGAVDVVTIANNHTIDFFDIGYHDTRNALAAEGIAYFGNEFNTIVEVNGIKVGLFGFRIWNTYQFQRDRIEAAIYDLRARGAQLIIAYHHWGYENVNLANATQREMGRFTVRAGADLVLGSHPHVIQGIEVYQERYIVYSLANFCFGGNSNPPDQDSFIFQQTFTFREGELIGDLETKLIPVLVSSTRAYNNFQPTPAEGADAERILRRLETYSAWLERD